MCLAECVNADFVSEATPHDAPILVERVGHIARVTLNRPDKLNALTPDMGPMYARTLVDLDADPEVRGILVTGAGRGFCSGADLATLAGSKEELRAYVAGQGLDTLPLIALTLSTPVATAVNGPCAGIGFVLAASADRRFVHPDATLSSTFARLGLVAEYGIAWLLPRLIGLPAATDLLVTGRTITGQEAERIGLATCTPDPATTAQEWLADISENCAPSSVAAMKRQLHAADSQTLGEAIESSLLEMSAAFDAPDFAEALAARVERRAPRFAGYPRPT